MSKVPGNPGIPGLTLNPLKILEFFKIKLLFIVDCHIPLESNNF